jgi:CheY-like chemotaxis protein
VKSELGEGSTFLFSLNFAVATQEQFLARKSQEKSLKRSVLIVDDSEMVRKLLLGMVQANGFFGRAVSSGEEALSAIVHGSQIGQPFDLVLMDWRLPGIDGIEASRRIKEHPTLRPIPAIVMISAFESEEVLRGLKQPRFDGFLVKPITETVLMRTIVSIIGEKIAGPDSGLEPVAGNLPSDLTGRRVLVVEDNEINRDLASELLSDLGIWTAVAIDGRHGVDQILEQPFDLVLMDIQMPVMDGLAATRLIRADARFHDLPIIAMTAHAMRGDRERSLDSGMNDHLTKPINPAALSAILSRWMPAKPQDPPAPGVAQ